MRGRGAGPTDPDTLHSHPPFRLAEQPFGLGEVLGAIGVEEGVQGLGREVHLSEPVASSPLIDLAQALLDQGTVA